MMPMLSAAMSRNKLADTTTAQATMADAHMTPIVTTLPPPGY
jgi:hypothetical protein